MSDGARLDLHVHSTFSPDGRATVEALVAAARRQGLDGIALTDHNSVAGHRRLVELGRDQPELILLPGVEVSTRDGHLLAYGVRESPPTQRPVAESIDWIVAHGGVAVPAHPYRRVHGVGESIARSARVPALETINGHNGRRANGRASLLAAARSLGATGGSDAHREGELGRAFTEFPAGVRSTDALLDALGRGTTQSGGRSSTATERTSVALRSFVLRVGRGFRGI